MKDRFVCVDFARRLSVRRKTEIRSGVSDRDKSRSQCYKLFRLCLSDQCAIARMENAFFLPVPVNSGCIYGDPLWTTLVGQKKLSINANLSGRFSARRGKR